MEHKDPGKYIPVIFYCILGVPYLGSIYLRGTIDPRKSASSQVFMQPLNNKRLVLVNGAQTPDFHFNS